MSCIGTLSALVTGLTLASAEPVIVATNAPRLDSLNAALDAMLTDGTIKALETRWFN